MDTETYEIRKGAIVYKSRPPLDVRVVAYFMYLGGFVALAIGLLLSAGVVKPADDASRRVLFGAVVLTSSTAEAIYLFCTSGCILFCAWGLMRRMKHAWRFALIYNAYNATDSMLVFPKYPVNAAIGIVIVATIIAWLWFRRGYYGVRLAAGSGRKE
jgi:lysylphosphatidylglycerol synthetase-like protein (DUF2156 family)